MIQLPQAGPRLNYGFAATHLVEPPAVTLLLNMTFPIIYWGQRMLYVNKTAGDPRLGG